METGKYALGAFSEIENGSPNIFPKRIPNMIDYRSGVLNSF
jgi:hypothetical protein